MKATLRKLFGTVMAVSLLASSVSMGNVEAKAPAKKGPEIRYCKETNIEFWKHINGRGDDEPILYLKKNDILRHYTKARLSDSKQAFCTYLAWDRDGYMEARYLSKSRVLEKGKK